MSVTTIISYYCSNENERSAGKYLKENLISLRNQEYNKKAEVIICDDGSPSQRKYFPENGISIKFKNELNKIEYFKNLDFDIYIYHNTKYYQRTLLWEKAISVARNDKLIFLDDDTPFLKRNSLSKYDKYLNNYSYVKGRVISFFGNPHMFSDLSVQGTNFAFTKNLYYYIGGFSDYLFTDSFGDDDDITYKIYRSISDSSNTYHACYAGDILVSNNTYGRWHSGNNNKNKRNELFCQNFMLEYGIQDSYSIGSRNKSLWLVFPSLNSILLEIFYVVFHSRFLRVRRLFTSL